MSASTRLRSPPSGVSDMSRVAKPSRHAGAVAGATPLVRTLWKMSCERGTVYTKSLDSQPAAVTSTLPMTATKAELPDLPDTAEIEDSHSQSQWHQNDNHDGLDEFQDELSQVLRNPAMMLSGEQKAVLHMVLNSSKNIFFTGAAGTGKSVLLRCLISQLRRDHPRDEIAVTALTGIAACNIGGQTLHRWAGIGLGQGPIDQLERVIKRNRRTLARWRSTRVLLVDEVSMLRCDLLDKLEELARRVRGNNIPFGGIQLVFTGDLFQLPPVVARNETDKRFCFESPTWDAIIDRTVNLTRVFRQRDPRFAEVLNELRLGRVTPATDDLFKSLVRPPRMPKGIVPTKLFSSRAEVNRANQAALKRLDGPEYVYECTDWRGPAAERDNLNMDAAFLADPSVSLKVGAQVMLIKNIDNSLVNGSIGRVVAFVSRNGSMSYVDDANQRSAASSKNIGESNANGGTLTEIPDQSKKDTAKEIEQLLGSTANSTSARRKRQLAEDMSDELARTTAVLPIVRFVTQENTVRFLIVQPEVWEIEDAEGNAIASRSQIPLMLAWALSIHKAQGQTLPYVSVNLERVFEKGQAYVAISRATCLEGLQIHRFDSAKVRVDTKVVQYYDQLECITDDDIREAEEYFDSELKRLEDERLTREEKLREMQVQAEKEEATLARRNRRKARSMVLEPENPPPLPDIVAAHSHSGIHESNGDGNDLLFSDVPEHFDHIADTLAEHHSGPVKRARVIIESSSPAQY